MSEISAFANITGVSFIDNTTLEKVETEMMADFTNKFKELTGGTGTLADADPCRLVLLSVAKMEHQDLMWIDHIGKMNLLKYSTGEFLDNLALLKKLTRHPATYAETTLLFTMTSARGEATPIPGGIRVATDSGLYFMTNEYAEIPSGEVSAEVKAIALETGESSNGQAEGTIVKIVDPVAYIASVTNTTISRGGADIENDEDFTKRIYEAPSSYSVAGPTDSYEYHAKQFRPDVSDVKAYSPSPSCVNVLFLFDGGVLPTEDELAGMCEHLSGKTKRPTSDKVTALAPTEQGYNINLTYYINRSDSAQAVVIQSAVDKAIEEYKTWQRKLGRDINPTELIMRIRMAGAKRVELTDPVHAAVNDESIAKLETENVIYGGLEDD